MPKKSAKTQKQLVAENKDLRARLDEAEETLRAIRSGEVDALVVTTDQGEQLFTLKGAEHSYRVLVEQMGEGAATLSVEGAIMYCNRRFAEMVGVPIEQVIGRDFRAFISPLDRAALDAALESKTGARQEIECALTAGVGTSTPARLALVFLPLETPPVFGLTAADLTHAKRRERELDQARENLEARVAERTAELQREIAERKQAIEALRASEERYRILVENQGEGIGFADPDERFIFANPAAESIFGVLPGGLIGRNLAEFVIPAQLAAIREQTARRRAGEKNAYEIEIVRPDGAKHSLLVTAVPRFDEAGRFAGAFGIFRDITDRKRAEVALQESEERYRAVVEDQTELISRFREDGTFTFVNDVLCRFFNKSEKELIGNKWEPVAVPEDLPAIKAQLHALSPAHPAVTIENRVLSGAGQLRWMQFVNRGVFDGAGRLVEIQSVGRDITDRKQLEEKLKALSIHDALTGLYNRGFFEEEMTRLGRGRQFPVSIVMADLNDLKETNDRDGHAAGDALLRRAARVLKDAFRADDILARIGGDEFAVLLPATDAVAAQQSLQRVRGALEVDNAAHGGARLSIAFGVSTAEQDHALTDALKEADARMYEEKRGESNIA